MKLLYVINYYRINPSLALRWYISEPGCNTWTRRMKLSGIRSHSLQLSLMTWNLVNKKGNFLFLFFIFTSFFLVLFFSNFFVFFLRTIDTRPLAAILLKNAVLFQTLPWGALRSAVIVFLFDNAMIRDIFVEWWIFY